MSDPTLLFMIGTVPVYQFGQCQVTWSSGCAIDADGEGDSLGDRYYQPATSLKMSGHSLNAQKDKYIVVPPQLLRAAKGIVLGCTALVRRYHNGTYYCCWCVAGDVGRATAIGEVSIAAAHELGIPESPVSGGTREAVVFRLWPGIPAEGYVLQPSIIKRREKGVF